MANLTAERKAQLESWLVAAEEALQRLMMGEQERSISHGNSASNSAISFQDTSEEKLRRRIDELKSELGLRTTNQLRPFVPSIY